MYNDIVCDEQGNTEKCLTISVEVTNYARRFRADIGHFWDLGQGRDGAELVSLTEIGIESLKE